MTFKSTNIGCLSADFYCKVRLTRVIERPKGHVTKSIGMTFKSSNIRFLSVNLYCLVRLTRVINNSKGLVLH